MAEKEGFILYKSFYAAITALPAESGMTVFKAISEYALYGREPEGELTEIESAMFALMKPSVDKANSRYETNIKNGQKGGRPKTQDKPKDNPNKTQEKPKQNPKETQGITQSEPKQNLTVAVAVTDTVTVTDTVAVAVAENNARAREDNSGGDDGEKNDLDYKKIKAVGGTLGRGVVMLSQYQEEELLKELSLDEFDYYLAKLASFIIDKGAKVANHYATILKWANEDRTVTRTRGGIT